MTWWFVTMGLYLLFAGATILNDILGMTKPREVPEIVKICLLGVLWLPKLLIFHGRDLVLSIAAKLK